ncbi:MAG: iron-containing alcohol dehydrogenase [Haloarculaceae archaeon]
MAKHFTAPGAYVQGPGVLGDAAEPLAGLRGRTAYLLGGRTALSVAEEALAASLDEAGVDLLAADDDVERCTRDAVADYAGRIEDSGADVVVGVGGGVSIDVATAVAAEAGTEFVSVPTIASTDAPCSALGVLYDEAGNVLGPTHRDRNPEVVLVDTRVIARAPARFLRHGMGDAFATRFEAEAVARSGASTAAAGRSSDAALVLAREAYDRLAGYGPDALAAARRDAVTPAFEKIVETNVLLSGLGFESGGTAGAHAIQGGLTNVGVREPHGLLVGFGTVAELVLQDRDPDEMEAALSTYFDCELDVTLDELGVDDAQIDEAGRIACDRGMEKEPRSVTPAAVADAVRAADELIRRRRD